jgi:chromosome segregation ATPase
MKSTILSILCLLLTSVCWGQDKAAQIADVKNQIAALESETPAMLDKLGALKTERENQIDFVGQAYDKQKANFEQEAAAFQQKVAEVKHQEAILAPSIENYNQRVQAHNAHQCTEKCVNGSCDGSCAWYTAEKNQLDANQAQLQQAAAPIEARKAQLAQEASNLQETAGKLETIRTNLNSEVESWKGRVAELKAQWEAHEAKMAALEAQLAALYGSANACMAEAKSSPTCQAPAYGPDGKPILNQDCERMVAKCRTMFDGSKP